MYVYIYIYIYTYTCNYMCVVRCVSESAQGCFGCVVACHVFLGDSARVCAVAHVAVCAGVYVCRVLILGCLSLVCRMGYSAGPQGPPCHTEIPEPKESCWCSP